MTLMPVATAQTRLLALAQPLAPEEAPLEQCAGRYLAAPLIALRDQPWADLSAMDGYAVRAGDGAGPWMLHGVSQAGGAPPAAPLPVGGATRIFTGAPLPHGADSIVLQEDVRAYGDRITLSAAEDYTEPGRHVRPKGSDFVAGTMLLEPGSAIGPAQIALAALGGHGALVVRRRPRVAILSTGDELVPPGSPVAPGQLPASNGVMLRAMIERAGGEVIAERLVPDRLEALTDALEEAKSADIVLTSGGASVGDHDLVRPAIAAAGGKIDFWKIAMRPGKPLIAGRLANALMLGLPGNPVSALVTGSLFLLPLIRHLAGSASPLPTPETALLAVAMPAVGLRDDYARAILRGGEVEPLGPQDSAATAMASRANALIMRPAHAPAAPAGAAVQLLRWQSLGLA